MKTRRLLPFACAVLAAVASPGVLAGESIPARQIRFAVPYPTGGPLDTVARVPGQKVAVATHANSPSRYPPIPCDAGRGFIAVTQVGNTPGELAAFVRSQAARYAKPVKASGAKVD